MRKMKKIKQEKKSVNFVMTVILITTTFLPSSSEGRRLHKRFVIHVPFRIKTHHHTHTVYSQVQSGGMKQTVYKILGYSSHGHGMHGQGKGKGYGHDGHGHGHGEISYEDMHDCNDGHSQGDMIFNHYSRNDEDYPDVEDFLEFDQGDEWE